MNNKQKQTVELPVSIGDVYYTKSLVFYDGIDATGEPVSDIQLKVHAKVINNFSDIYEYMMRHERGQAYLTEEEANDKIKL